MKRELTSHKVNGLNDALTIEVLDEPGAGGANHEYAICVRGSNGVNYPHYVTFQKGPISEAGVNGISQEALLAIVEDRLACFQAGPFAHPWNALALGAVQSAMEYLHERTKERVERGVEGTSAK